MALGTVQTSAVLTVGNTKLPFLTTGGEVMVIGLNPREGVNISFAITDLVGTPTDNVDWEVLGGVRLASSETSQAGGSTTTCKLQSGQSAVDGFFRGCYIVFESGTYKGKMGVITGYVGSTLVATFTPALAGAPDSHAYSIYSFRPIDSGQISKTALGVEQFHVSGTRIIAPPYFLSLRADRDGTTDAHKAIARYQVDGVSA